jgi:glycoside/pentoside/hexuronide:cation symporter, GPH family
LQLAAAGSPDSTTYVKLPFKRLVAYATLQLPLNMAALPVVLNVPKFYGDALGLSFAALGTYLLITRIIDALQDPLIGYISDRMTKRPRGRLLFVFMCMPLLVGGFFMLFDPPSKASLGVTGLTIWLIAALIIVHLGYAGVSISYHAHGADLTDDYNERTRVTVAREVFGLTGMTLAVVLPALLINPNIHGEIADAWKAATAALATAKAAGDGAATAAAQATGLKQAAEIKGYGIFGILFIPLALLCFLPSYLWSPNSVHPPVERKSRASVFHDFLAPLKNPRFRRLLLVFVVNGSALGIAVSVMLFYVEYVLKGTTVQAGMVLLTYFVSAAASVPLWMWLSKRTSKAAAWFAAMVLTVVSFGGAGMIGEGQIGLFIAVAVLTGLALGADYGLPPSILADIIHAEEGADSKGETGAYFGLWALSTKLATAVGAALSLPVAAMLGFDPGNAKFDTNGLVVTYIMLPIAVKVLAGLLIWYIRIEAMRPSVRDVVMGGK